MRFPDFPPYRPLEEQGAPRAAFCTCLLDSTLNQVSTFGAETSLDLGDVGTLGQQRDRPGMMLLTQQASVPHGPSKLLLQAIDCLPSCSFVSWENWNFLGIYMFDG